MEPSMPQSIPPGLTREQVLRAPSDLDKGIDHPFGPPTGYELLFQDKRYPPKAAVDLACRDLLGRVLLPDEFSGGEAPGQANFVLRKLGFTVVKKGEVAVQEEKQANGEWSGKEVRLVVADYFAMLEHDLLGTPYSKGVHRLALLPQLDNRDERSLECKHGNISVVLAGQGLRLRSDGPGVHPDGVPPVHLPPRGDFVSGDRGRTVGGVGANAER